MCESELRMKILLIFTLCLITDGGDSKEVTGYSGGGVLIKCKYDTGYTQNKKYFCKGLWSHCFDQIKTEVKNKWINSGRFSLYDDTKSAEFRVMIRELSVQDTETYHCGVDIQSMKDFYTTVELKVKEDLSYEKSICETVHGGDLNFSCKYPESVRSNPKFLCNMRLQDFACCQDASVKESRRYVNMGKFSLYDDRERQILSVSIRNVTERDSGEYWCGAEAAWESDDGYKVYFTRINLTVTDLYVPVSTSVPTKYSSPSLRSSSLSSSSSSSSWSTPTSLERDFPVSTVMTVSVSLLVLLVGIIFLTVTLYKRHKSEGPERSIQTSRDTNRDVLYFQSSEMTNQSISVYQNLNPNTNQLDSVYQSLNPNTNQLDSVYQSLKPKNNQSDSVYQSLNPNTNQSNFVYQSLNLKTNQSNSGYQNPQMLNQPTGHSRSGHSQGRTKIA